MKKIVLFTLILILAVTLLACSNTESNGEPNSSDDPNTLVIWAFADTHKQFFDEVAEEFKKTHPDVTVEVNLMEFGSLVDRYQIIVQSGGEGAPDLLDIEQGGFPNFIRGDIPFEPLNDYMEKDNLTGVMSEGRQALYTVDGLEYGVEHAATASVLYYRKDIFDEAGIDVPSLKTWDEFVEASKQLVTPDRFIFPANEGNATGSERAIFELLIRQEGGDIVNPDGSIGINSPEGLIALQRIKDWKEIGIMDTTNPDGPAYWEAYNNGRYLASIGPDWRGNALADNAPDLSGKWAAAPLPLGGPNSVPTTVWGGTGLAISKYSTKKDLAWEYLKLAQLTPEMSVKRFNIINLFPALLTSVNDPGLAEPSKYTEYFGGQNLAELYGELVEVAPRQNQAWWRPLIAEAWEEYQYEYANGNLTPEEFLANVEQELERLISEEEARQQ